jgi:hypothetical protein
MITEPVVFYPEIDWENPISEEEFWVTNIFTAWSGVEQRRSRRSIPNRRFSYTVDAHNELDFAISRALIYGGQTLKWLFPLWMSMRRTTQQIEADDETVWADTSLGRFTTGQAVMFFQRPRRYLHRLITGVAADHINFDGPLGDVWIKGRTQVIPLMMGRLSPDIDITMTDLQSGFFSIIFDAIVTEPIPYDI